MTLSMARFRSKSCPAAIIVIAKGAGEVCENTAGERELPGVRTDTAAGRCGVKDQVSTRSPLEVPVRPVG
ncbi:MAG TPA: hypothetical protein VNF05_09055 [Acidimicrobiales bacterium]|nr:hypothetical protein [Acidimicrobiales bacterium]